MPEALRCPHCGVGLDADAPHGLCPSCLLEEGIKDPGEGSWSRGSPATTPYTAGFTPPEAADLAGLFPQLEILELLGYGGMGAVYKARQVRLDRLVALKVLPPEAGRDPSFAERFTREARALARLNHPHIVGVHDFGEHEGLFYFIMEYVDGANLRRLLADGPLSPALALQIVPQICDALQYAHEEGVVHRDVKPENILLDQKGRVKIADFGLAKLLGQPPMHTRLTASRQVMGTPHYMAPEQMDRPLTVDHRADIYSLGVVFYEMLTGELPLGRFAPPSQRAGMDERLDAVIFRALENQAERRYQRVSELQRDVLALGATAPVGTPRPERRPPQPAAWPDMPELSVAFHIPQTFSSLQGIIRLQRDDLDVEFVHHYPLGTGNVKERRIPLREIKSVKLERGLSKVWLTLTAHRLSTLADFARARLNQAEFIVPKRDLETARELAAQIRQRLAAFTPMPAGQAAPAPPATPPPAKPARLGAFFRSILYYCVNSSPKQQLSQFRDQPGTEPGVPVRPIARVADAPEPGPETRRGFRAWLMRHVQQWLLLGYFACLICFLSFVGSGGPEHRSFHMGFPSPWWTIEVQRQAGNFSSSSNVNLWSWSFLIFASGLCALEAAWIMEKRLAARAGQRLSSAARWKWAVILVLSLVMLAAGITAGLLMSSWTF